MSDFSLYGLSFQTSGLIWVKTEEVLKYIPSVIWGTSLCVEKTPFGKFRDVQVTKFSCAILIEENVRRFEVSMEDLKIMKRL